ncbi:MAG: hypothetical protein KDC49_02345 [Saprospiraceae bacterium]|nr:hypothetical protein [Saprospiraceae bacterium]
MIKFFRKIRQKLVAENRLSKYLLYAIGEIVLVVIGILIALQINNWNEENKVDSTRQSYYHQLLKDLRKDITYIEYMNAFLDSMNNEYKDYLQTFEAPKTSLDQAFIDLDKLDMRTRLVVFNTNTIETLENTGDIKLIPTQIRILLSDLKNNQDRAIQAVHQNNMQVIDLIKLGLAEIGGVSLNERLSNQPLLKESLENGINRSKAFVLF